MAFLSNIALNSEESVPRTVAGRHPGSINQNDYCVYLGRSRRLNDSLVTDRYISPALKTGHLYYFGKQKF